ncbi:hypothetical protein MPH_01594 [Macrophomina phaseolina MS6]|uniref:Uncharacterized protein n=1 Tax=Macrophomina phaseolina (strain MS6) TaxID=1126212 RepID=K2S846_MACPH|nr:hypothetical protein MPH_01594 [Macrophomina phaseolina MS6]
MVSQAGPRVCPLLFHLLDATELSVLDIQVQYLQCLFVLHVLYVMASYGTEDLPQSYWATCKPSCIDLPSMEHTLTSLPCRNRPRTCPLSLSIGLLRRGYVRPSIQTFLISGDAKHWSLCRKRFHIPEHPFMIKANIVAAV